MGSGSVDDDDDGTRDRIPRGVRSVGVYINFPLIVRSFIHNICIHPQAIATKFGREQTTSRMYLLRQSVGKYGKFVIFDPRKRDLRSMTINWCGFVGLSGNRR